MDSREFTEWMGYYRLEPFGWQRADVHAGIVAATVANVNRDKKKHPKPYVPSDFIIEFDKDYVEPDVMSPEETLQAVLKLHTAMGGTVPPELVDSG